MSVDAGRENILSFSTTTTCCSAADLAIVFFVFLLGELVTVTFNFIN